MAIFNEIRAQMEKYPGLTGLVDQLIPYAQEMKNLYHYGMVLMGPDSFRQGEVLEIIEFFEKQGFSLKAIRTKRISRTETENLFLPTSTCTQCKSLKWWMIQDSSNMGEFAAAIFYSDTATQESHCLWQLNQYKGKSDPLQNSVGVVRYDFKAINICLNLIHIPDTYGDFFKDTSPFFTAASLFSLIAGYRRQDLENELFLASLYNKPKNNYVFETTNYKIKYLLAFQIFCIFQSTEDCLIVSLLEYYKGQYNYFDQEKMRESRHFTFVNNISKEKGMLFDIQNSIVRQMVKVHHDKSLFTHLVNMYSLSELLFMVTDPTYFMESADSFFAMLSAHHIFVDPYEQLILNTTLLQWK